MEKRLCSGQLLSTWAKPVGGARSSRTKCAQWWMRILTCFESATSAAPPSAKEDRVPGCRGRWYDPCRAPSWLAAERRALCYGHPSWTDVWLGGDDAMR